MLNIAAKVDIMKVTLISPDLQSTHFKFTPKEVKSFWFAKLTLPHLAALTPDDIEVTLIDEAVDPINFDEPTDLVGITVNTYLAPRSYEISAEFRKRGVPVVLGGVHPSLYPKEAMQHADAIVIGEGEPLWPQLLQDFQHGKLSRVYDARSIEYDLADAPMPRFDLLEPNNYNRLTVQTQRGCPYRCDFCASSIRLSPTYKIKPVEKILAEIRHIKEIWPDPFIEFADDNSFVNRVHAKKLLTALKDEHIRWFIEADISIADDPELLDLMRDSGCAQVLIGLESPNIVGLDRIEQKTNWKAKRLDGYKAAIERIQSRGITVNGCFVLGLDNTGTESFDEVFQFVETSGLYDVQITIMTPFPGTPLYDRLLDNGRILEQEAWELCTLFDVNFKPDKMNRAELENGFRELVEKLYSEEETQNRRRRFRHQLQ